MGSAQTVPGSEIWRSAIARAAAKGRGESQRSPQAARWHPTNRRKKHYKRRRCDSKLEKFNTALTSDFRKNTVIIEPPEDDFTEQQEIWQDEPHKNDWKETVNLPFWLKGAILGPQDNNACSKHLTIEERRKQKHILILFVTLLALS